MQNNNNPLRMVATTSNRPQINFWDPNNNYSPKGEITPPDI